jgi:putative endonuclease
VKPVPHFVYLLRCADGSLYAGCTNNLARRLAQHNAGKRGARYTRSRRPVVLVYTESFSALRPARQRESVLKTLSRAQKLALIAAAPQPKKSRKAPRRP